MWQPWFGAKSLLSGIDPYPIVGPGKPYPHEFEFLYPLTASVAVFPLGWLSYPAATGIFAGVSTALLAYNARYYRWPLFVSVPFLTAAWAGQWSPLLSAAFLVPSLAWLHSAKPSIGLALLLARGSRAAFRWALFGSLALLAVSALIVPTWPLEWLHAIMSQSHLTPPVIRPGGFIALLALTRWRRPEARLVAFLAFVPQTNLWYEAVPLFLVPRNFRQSLILAISTSAPLIYEVLFGSSGGTVELWPKDYQLAIFAYSPCVAMVFLRSNSANDV